MKQSEVLPDGEYPCMATLVMKNGKAVLILHSTFKLAEGTKIPLLRSGEHLEVTSSIVSNTELRNGHTII